MPPENTWMDAALYPDAEVPKNLDTLSSQIDFLVRLCGAWDFGILPSSETVTEIRKPEWQDAVDACRMLTSPAYHLLRRWHQLPGLPFLGQQLAYIRDDPNLHYV